MINVSNIVLFTLLNRRNGVFTKYTSAQITQLVCRMMNENRIMVAVINSEILGIICADTPDVENKTIKITNALFDRQLTKMGSRIVLSTILNNFIKLYGAGWTFKFNRFKTPEKAKHLNCAMLAKKLGLQTQ